MHHTVQLSLVNRMEALLLEVLKTGPDKLEDTILAGNSALGPQHEVQVRGFPDLEKGKRHTPSLRHAFSCTERVKSVHKYYIPVFLGRERSPAEKLKGSEKWGLSESHLITSAVLALLSPTHMPFHA